MDRRLEAQLLDAMADLFGGSSAALRDVLKMIAQEDADLQQILDRQEALLLYLLMLPPDLEARLPLTNIVNYIAETQEFRRSGTGVYRDLVQDLRLFHDVGFPGRLDPRKQGLLRQWWAQFRQRFDL